MRIKSLILYLVVVVLSINTAAYGQSAPTALPQSEVEWFKEAKFGMFIHWGLYSILEGSYNGRTLPDASLPNGKSWYAEWIHTRLEVPPHEYQQLAKEFNPINFDADEWISEAKNAGMRYFVITSKHHDGFALWDTQVSDYNIMNSPFKRDILQELVDACKKHDVKYGFYYSHWQDWEHEYGAWPNWIPPRISDSDFEKYWKEKSLPQVRELIEKFDPDLMWFDTWEEEHHITDHRRDELISMIRSLSDKCLINGRISFTNPGESIDFLEMHDNSYPKEILDKPWQTPATMTHSWGWHANDFNWKPATQMIEYLVNNASKGGNYLLNIGPKPDGTFPNAATRRLREIGAWLHSNSEAVYGTLPVKVSVPDNIYLTQSSDAGGRNLFVTITAETERVILPFALTDIASAEVVETGQTIEYTEVDDGIELKVPITLYRGCNIPVVRLKMKN